MCSRKDSLMKEFKLDYKVLRVVLGDNYNSAKFQERRLLSFYYHSRLDGRAAECACCLCFQERSYMRDMLSYFLPNFVIRIFSTLPPVRYYCSCISFLKHGR